MAHLPLRALKTLLNAGRDGDQFAAIFAPLQDVFTFDQALVLNEGEAGLACVAASPPALAELPWAAGSFFREVAGGRVAVTCGDHQLEEWRHVPRDVISPAQPALYLPIRVHGCRGVLLLLRAAGKAGFSHADVALARQLAVVALAALAARQATAIEAELRTLRRRAYSDDLTGLANRAMIQEHVEGLLRAGHGKRARFALAFIDLDNFKHVNDYYSHAIGDALLVKVAQRIAGIVRETDLAARISGDEFVLLVDPAESNTDTFTLVERLLERLKQPFHIEGFEIFTSASIGVSIYPEHGCSYEELRKNANSAMSRAKSGAKGAIAYYDLQIGEVATARMELEQQLRLAIRDRQFCCAFQPKVDIRSREVIGFETLVRWRDDKSEIHPPSAFIGLATELGLIDPITHFVLGEAIGSLDVLDDQYGPGKTVAINVAAKQAGDLEFMHTVIDALKASGCAERFIVEVTEDAFIATNRFQTQVLPMLRDIGVRVSIDDFGTGYSSLSVLADITADEIKIDRSFIADIHRRPRSQSILRAIESVSYALGMSVIAEGVESFEELAYLLGATRIRYAQGYHFAAPFLLEDVAAGRRADQREASPGRERSERREFAPARTAAAVRGG